MKTLVAYFSAQGTTAALAKALAEKLEESHVRCRLELLKEDRAFHRFGDGGMGTRMRVLVAPSDYDAAKKLLLEGEKR